MNIEYACMPPKAPLFLTHMLESINSVETFVRNRQESELSTDRLLRSAVYYEPASIGEALSKLREVAPEIGNRISDARKIVGFRNEIIHGYAVIRDDITWHTIHTHLPILKQELTALIAEA